MAAADEILGISGQMDISDIQSSIDKLCDSLNRVGIDTETLSERMTKALTDVSKSDDDLATKTQRAMQILKSAMDEAVKSIQIVPNMIDNANKRVGDIESSIHKLNERLNDTEKGSGAFEAITKQINVQKQSLQLAKEDVLELTDSYNHAKNSISEVNGAYQALGALSVASTGANSAQTVSNTAVSASATAAATATVAEAAAHSANTAAATANAVAENQNAQATQQLTDSLREYISVSAGRAEIDRMQSENAKDLKSDIKLYEDAIKEIQNTLNTSDFSGKIKETTEQIEKYKLKISTYKQEIKNLSADENTTGQGVSYYNRLILNAEQKISDLQKKVNEWGQEQSRLNSDLQEYNTLLDAAKRIQSGEKLTDSFKNTAKEAKETAKETQNIGKEAEKAEKKVKGIFGGLKSSFAGLMKGDFSALFGFVGKIGAWGAAIAAVGKGLYDASKAAEAFRVSLQPLDHYMDSDKIKDLRQNILALSSTTSKSCVDMADAALQFVKVWDGLKNSPEALTRMIKAANEFGALAGKTSAESAKSIAEISGEYHLTAEEATNMSNVIATASRNTTSSFGDMAEAIKSAGSTASLYGISFKEMSSLIGFSSNQFGGASKAASKFSMLLMSMSRLQKEYNPSMVGMVTALKNLKKAYDRGENVGEKFMARNRATAMYFIKNAEAIEKYNKTIGNAATKEELLADINTRADVNLKKLNNAWNGFLTSLNANLTPVLTNILRFFNRIIGGATQTADELNYLKNYDKNHKGSRKSAEYVDAATSGMGAFSESAVVAMGANESYRNNKKENFELYKKQRDRLQKWYKAGVNAAKRRYQNASPVALANAGENVVRNVLKKQGNRYSEFTTDILDDFLSRQRRSTYAMQQQTINTNVKLGGIGGTQGKNKTAGEQKKAQEELNKMLQELEQKNIDANIALMKEGTEKKLKEIDNDYKKRLAEIKKQEDEFRKKNKEAGKGANLTDAQSKAIEKSKVLANQDRIKKIEKLNNDLIESEKSGLYAFLKEYGDIENKKLAITEEYADKIAKAENAYQKASLERQRDNELRSIDKENVFEQIDWENVFSDLSSHTKKYLETLRNQLQTLLKSGKLTDIEDIAKVQEKINDINSEISKQGGLFDFVGEKQQEHIRRINEAKEAQEALNLAKSKEQDIEKQYEEALKAANHKAVDLGVRAIGDDTADIQSNLNKFDIDKSTAEYKEMSTLLSRLAVLEGELSEARKKTARATKEATSKEDGTKRSSAQSIADWFADAQEFITKKGIDELPGLFENLGMGGIAKKASEGLSAFNSASGAAADFATHNYIGAALKSVYAIKSFGKMFGIGGGNGAEVAKRTQELTESNQRLQYSIEQLKSSIDKSSGIKAVSNYQEAYKAQEVINKQVMDILRTQMGYHGSHHSNAYYWNLSASDYASINKTLAQQAAIKGGYTGATINRVNSLEDLYKLTPEQMNDIRTYNQDIWKEMLEQGKYDKSEYWEKYTELAGKLEELTEQINQNLTQTSFDAMKNDFLSSLTDMSKSAQDFADDFTAMLNKSMLNFAISKLMDEKLKPLYEKWANKMKENGGRNLTSDEINDLKEEYQKIIDEGIKERDTIAAITGYDEAQSRQTATGKAIEAITADQASTLTGIGYAMQIALEHGNDTRTQISMDVSVMRGYAEAMAANMSEMRDIQHEGLGQLQQIVKNTAPISLIRDDISSMYKLMKERY